MATYGSCSILVENNDKKSEGGSRELPFPVYLSLMMLGLWRPSRPRIWSVEWSASGHERTGLDDGENTKILEHDDTLEMTDYISEAEVWSPEKPKRNKSDHQGLGASDFVFLTIMASTLVLYDVDVFYYISGSWGHKNFFLDTISHICFISQTFSIVAYALYTRLSTCLRIFYKSSPKIQVLPFEMEFIGNRVALIQQNCNSTGLGHKGCLTTGKFISFLFSPLVNAIVKIAFDMYVFKPRCQFAFQYINHIVESLCFLCYGCFWYILYVERVSLHCQLNLALDKIRQLAYERDNESSRRLIDRIYSEFHVIRKFTGIWMAFTLFSVTVHFVCCVVFIYQDSINIDAVASVESQESSTSLLILMLCTQNLMFFVVPYCAVGGANLEYMWHRFRHVLTKCKIKDQLEFWREAEIYVAQINTLGTRVLEWTWVFSFLGAITSVGMIQNHYRSLEHWYYRYYCDETLRDVLE